MTSERRTRSTTPGPTVETGAGALTITSPANDRVKLLRGLSGAAARRRAGMTLVEGITLVKEALDSGASFVTAARDEESIGSARVTELVDLLRERGIDVWTATHRVFKGMSQMETPQGILAAIDIPDNREDATLRDVIGGARASGDALVVLMDGIQDPGNAGAIVRSGDAFGATCLLFGAPSADPYNPKVLRASMGSVFHLPCLEVKDAPAVADSLIAAGFRLFYGDAKASIPVYSADLSGLAAIVVGNEAAGVSEALKERGTPIAVPIHGMAESLNVAMALTAMLYEARRQRSVAL